MSRARTLTLALVAVCALGAVASSAAFAAQGPYYKISGTRLESGKTHSFKVSARTPYVLKGTIFGVVVTTKCTALKVNTAATLVGSTGKNGGSSKEILEYSGCTVEGNGAECKVENNEVKTKEVLNELAYSTSTRTGKILTAFVPASGNAFVTIKYTGTCTTNEVTVEGSAVAEDENSKGELIEVGKNEKEEEKGILVNKAVNGTKYWTESGGVLTEHEAKLSFAFFGSATIEGSSNVELGTGVNWGVFTT